MSSSTGRSKQNMNKVISDMVVNEVNSCYGKKSGSTILAVNISNIEKIYVKPFSK